MSHLLRTRPSLLHPPCPSAFLLCVLCLLERARVNRSRHGSRHLAFQSGIHLRRLTVSVRTSASFLLPDVAQNILFSRRLFLSFFVVVLPNIRETFTLMRVQWKVAVRVLAPLKEPLSLSLVCPCSPTPSTSRHVAFSILRPSLLFFLHRSARLELHRLSVPPMATINFACY